MKLPFLLIFGFVFCLFNHQVYSQSGIVDKSTGEVFPDEVGFEYDGKKYQLEATGVATRKKLIVAIYSIAHYLQKGVSGDRLQEILSDANAKQFTIKWVHEASIEKVQDAFADSFHRVFTPEQEIKMQSEINKFKGFFTQGTTKGDVFVFRWVPGGHIIVLINGKEVGNVTNVEFATGLWKIWFGQKSVVDVKDLLSHH